jgi:hypothetical protein
MDETHWWPIMSGEAPVPEHLSEDETLMLRKPPDWQFFTQPQAMFEHRDSSGRITRYDLNPKAENLNNLIPDYYPQTIQGKRKDWIDVYILNKLGSVATGRSVYEGSFNRAFHVRAYDAEPIPGTPLLVGLDFGLTPAAIICQQLTFGRYRVLREICLTEIGAKRFGLILKTLLNQYAPPNTVVKLTGDPAGDQRSGTDEMTPFRILAGMGLFARPAPTNDPTVRIEAVDNLLTRVVDGQPAIEINPSCTTLIRGFENGYHFRKRRTSMGDEYEPIPDKNRYSHIHDALQYVVIGEGEANRLFGGQGAENVVHNVAPAQNIWQRHRSRLKGRRRANLRAR